MRRGLAGRSLHGLAAISRTQERTGKNGEAIKRLTEKTFTKSLRFSKRHPSADQKDPLADHGDPLAGLFDLLKDAKLALAGLRDPLTGLFDLLKDIKQASAGLRNPLTSLFDLLRDAKQASAGVRDPLKDLIDLLKSVNRHYSSCRPVSSCFMTARHSLRLPAQFRTSQCVCKIQKRYRQKGSFCL